MIPQEQENGIIISATEPVRNRRKIWIRKGKNLYNPETMPLTQGQWINSNTIINQAKGWYVVVPIEGGKTYTISKKYTSANDSSINFACMSTADYPIIGVAGVDTAKGTGTYSSLVYSTSSSANYLFIGLIANENPSAETKSNAIEQLQVEVSDSKTDYEAYVEPALFIKNENGNYDEFFSKKEVIKKQYTFKGLTFSVIKYKRIVEISINGSTDQSLRVNTFYDLQLDDIFKPLQQVDDNITLSTTEAGMIRISPTGLFRIYPWTNLDSGKGFRYNITYISAY